MDQNKNLHVVLIRSSLYDSDGYVLQFTKGVLPSNTLAVMNGLTLATQSEPWASDITITTELYDECVDMVEPEKLSLQAGARPGKTVFCLCGVQSNQFPRASDTALKLSQAGHKVMLGGFHVSGIKSVFGSFTPEIDAIIDAGVTVVCGEVEGVWGSILESFWNNTLEKTYNFLEQKPQLGGPLPVVNSAYLRKFSVSEFSTLDCGRGCPFKCSFCSIINVHGNAMRARDTEEIRTQLIANYREFSIKFYFFTDDNFSRNRKWPEIFNMLRELREKGYDITFMMQVDLQAYKIPGFMDSAVAGGCTQVFLGMESLNPMNLASVGKTQNKVADYRDMVNSWRSRGVMTHAAYILGFPHDDAKSVRADLHTLAYDVGVDLASFFILTPIPGSMDHKRCTENGTPMDNDLNYYDTFHPVIDHPLMTRKEWLGSYNYAWKMFYSRRRIETILRQLSGQALRNMLGSYLWYKYSAVVANVHPMMAGFHRKKVRKSRRPSIGTENVLRYSFRRTADIMFELSRTLLLLLEFGYYYAKYFPRLLKRTAHGTSRVKGSQNKVMVSAEQGGG